MLSTGSGNGSATSTTPAAGTTVGGSLISLTGPGAVNLPVTIASTGSGNGSATGSTPHRSVTSGTLASVNLPGSVNAPVSALSNNSGNGSASGTTAPGAINPPRAPALVSAAPAPARSTCRRGHRHHPAGTGHWNQHRREHWPR